VTRNPPHDLTRNQLVDELYNRLPVFTRHDLTVVVDAVEDIVNDVIAARGRVELTGFGVFDTYERKARHARNPRTGEDVDVPGRIAPRFKVGTRLEESARDGKPAPRRGRGK
jgi:integration host factor subunit beta